MARVQALLRRSQGRLLTQQAAWHVDEEALRIAWRGQSLSLTPLEFHMLRLLLSRPGRVFSREQLLDAAHADLREVSDRTIDTHVKNLRKKIQQVDADADCLVNVYGVDYRFEPAQ